MADLMILHNMWYGIATKYEPITSTRICEMWANLWFCGTKDIDSKLKIYSDMIEKYTTYEPTNFYEKIALVILYDQVCRNVHRKTPDAYKYDYISNKICQELLTNFNNIPLHNKLTIIICLIHSENINDQNKVTELIENISTDKCIDPSILITITKIHSNHKYRVQTFGRIPERNKYVGRISTPKEYAYLSAIY